MADTITVTSSMFDNGGKIPLRAAHASMGGENVSPDLAWAGVPEGTQSIAVTCWDPDAPTGIGFVHWVLFNVDPATTSLPAGAGEPGKQPSGATLGFSDWGESRYGGMAPPPDHGDHNYEFRVYALDQKVDLDATTTYAKFRFMTRGHVLGEGSIVGRFAASDA